MFLMLIIICSLILFHNFYAKPILQKTMFFFFNRKAKKCSQWLSEDKRKRAFYLMKQSSVSMMYIEVLVIVEMPDCPEKRDTGSVWAFESVHSKRPEPS